MGEAVGGGWDERVGCVLGVKGRGFRREYDPWEKDVVVLCLQKLRGGRDTRSGVRGRTPVRLGDARGRYHSQ